MAAHGVDAVEVVALVNDAVLLAVVAAAALAPEIAVVAAAADVGDTRGCFQDHAHPESQTERRESDGGAHSYQNKSCYLSEPDGCGQYRALSASAVVVVVATAAND